MPSIRETSRLRVGLDAQVERVLLAPETEGFGLASRPPQRVDMADVAARAKRAIALRAHHDACHRAIMLPAVQRRRNRAHHPKRQRVQRLRRASSIQPASAAPLAHDLRHLLRL
jgi:hypothetical protein